MSYSRILMRFRMLVFGIVSLIFSEVLDYGFEILVLCKLF